MSGFSIAYRLSTMLLTLVVIVISNASEAHAQARWLTTKTKPFTSGKSVTEVLDELGVAHKFKVEYPEADTKDYLSGFKIHGNLEALPLNISLNLITGHLVSETRFPWTADKTTLTINDFTELVSATYDISRFSNLLNDADEFRYALIAATAAEWEDPEMPSAPDAGLGSIEDLTPTTVTIKQTPTAHMEIADLLNKLQIAASGNQREEKNAAEKKIEKVLDKQVTLETAPMTWEQLFAKVFTDNKVPYLLTQTALEGGFDPAAMVTPSGEKQKLREILEPLLTEQKLKLAVDSGAVLVTSVKEVSSDYSLQVYNIRRFLNTSTAAEVAAKVMEIEGLDITEPVELGPFLIIGGSEKDHQKVATAISGN
jgi:hypothetical protein